MIHETISTLSTVVHTGHVREGEHAHIALYLAAVLAILSAAKTVCS